MAKRKDECDLPIYKYELPSSGLIIQINYAFYKRSQMVAKKGQEAPIYLTHGFSKGKMKRIILEPDNEIFSYISKVRLCFPEKANIYEKSAYWYRAFSRGQLFPDANHRTGIYSWKNILKRKGLDIEADAYEIASLTDCIKSRGWIKQGQMNVKLNEKDEEYDLLKRWFKERLKLRQS